MAIQATIGGQGALFVGEDKTLRLEVLDPSSIPVDLTGWTIRFLVVSSVASVVLDKTATITGIYSTTRDTNTQRAMVTLTDTELSVPDGTHRHSWKRTDDGSETVLAYGDCIVERATQL